MVLGVNAVPGSLTHRSTVLATHSGRLSSDTLLVRAFPPVLCLYTSAIQRCKTTGIRGGCRRALGSISSRASGSFVTYPSTHRLCTDQYFGPNAGAGTTAVGPSTC